MSELKPTQTNEQNEQVETLQNVELIGVTSLCHECFDKWIESYKVNIKVNNIALDFTSDLKEGVLKETQKIFNPLEYNYSKWDIIYSRVPKEVKAIYGID